MLYFLGVDAEVFEGVVQIQELELSLIALVEARGHNLIQRKMPFKQCTMLRIFYLRVALTF